MEMKEKHVDGFRIKELLFDNIIIGIAIDIGPRILYLADSNKPDFNLFGILPKAGSRTPKGFWKIYGGHRLWSSPEAMPRSYSIDDQPIKIEKKGRGVLILGNPEGENSIRKEIEIKPYAKSGIEVIHRIQNIGKQSLKLGCWALSVMRQGGFAVIPFKPVKLGLLPDRSISVWPYTDLSDKRLILQDRHMFIRQQPLAKKPIKIGTIASPSWTAYYVLGTLFIKTFHKEKGEYPDFGCNVEVYTNSDMLELETLSPLKTLAPAEYVQHTEIWNIFEVGELTQDSDMVEEKLSKFRVVLEG